MAGRKHRSGHPRRPAKQRAAKATAQPSAQTEEKDAAIARLARELAETQAKLKEIEDRSTEAYTARKIESLLEAAQIARGQAFDASLARNKAEGRLRSLEKAILEARGPSGWLLRRAARRAISHAGPRQDAPS